MSIKSLNWNYLEVFVHMARIRAFHLNQELQGYLWKIYLATANLSFLQYFSWKCPLMLHYQSDFHVQKFRTLLHNRPEINNDFKTFIKLLSSFIIYFDIIIIWHRFSKTIITIYMADNHITSTMFVNHKHLKQIKYAKRIGIIIFLIQFLYIFFAIFKVYSFKV